MAFEYYSTAGGLDYDRVLKHFKDQASGSKNTVVLTGMKMKRNIVLVDTRSENVGDSGSPRLKVVDPIQNTVNQANSELKNTIIKERDDATENHSVPGQSRKRKSVGAEVLKRTKRARGIFSRDGR